MAVTELSVRLLSKLQADLQPRSAKAPGGPLLKCSATKKKPGLLAGPGLQTFPQLLRHAAILAGLRNVLYRGDFKCL